MVEAMSQGCAVVACDYKGRQTEAVCNNINGLICTPDNVDELAFKIKELINNDSLRTNLQFQESTRSPNIAKKTSQLTSRILSDR